MAGLSHGRELKPEPAGTGLSGRLISNTLAQFVAPTVRVALGLVLAAALGRYLGAEGFGQYALVFAYVATFNGVFNDWGLGTIVLREIAWRPEERAGLLSSGAALQGVVALGSYALMLGVLILLPYPPAVERAAAVFGLTLLFTPLDILALSFQADLNLARLVPPSLLGALLNAALILLVIALRGTLLALVAASLVALLVHYSWIGRLCLAGAPSPPRPTIASWVPLLREAWPLGLSTIFSTTMQQAPVLVLSWVSLEAAGLFGAAIKIPQQLLMLPLTVRNSVFPVLARSWVADRARFRRQIDRLAGGSVLVAVPMVIAGIGLAPWLMPLVFGPEFAPAAGPFALLIGMAGLMFPGILLGEALSAIGFQRVNLVIQIASSLVLLLLLAVLVPPGGATGAAWSLLLSYAVVVAATLGAARRRLGGAAPVSALAGGAAAAVAGGVGLVAAAPFGPALSSLVGFGAALAALACLRHSQVRELIASSFRRERMVGIGREAGGS